jgi:lipopolysaccharide export system permease protein
MILVRYLNRQVLQATAALAAVLLVVALLGRMLRYLAQASQGELDPGVLLVLMAYRIPGFLQLILPLALLLGILLAYGRMYAENEMTVLGACGISGRRLLKITLLSTLLTAGTVAFLSLYATPRSLTRAATLLEEQSNLNEFDLMVPGIFQNLSDGARTSYAETIERGVMHQVFMHEAQADRVIVADTAELVEGEDGRRLVQFRNGSLTEGLEGNRRLTLTTFDTMSVVLPPRDLVFEPVLEVEAMSNADLAGGQEVEQQAELQWRFSLIVLIPVLTLLAVPFSRVNPREGQFARIVPAILMYMAYFGLLLVSRSLIERGTLPSAIGLWWVHVVFATAGWLLLSGSAAALPGLRRFAHV